MISIPTFEEQDRVKIVRLSLNSTEPMFERVVSMTIYVVRSRCFSAQQFYLDDDAFLIRPISAVFKNDFDTLGLTHRHIVGQMSINEGVICKLTRIRDAVIRIFDSYVASYLATEESKKCENISEYAGGEEDG